MLGESTGPLAGVPVAIKDNLATLDLPTSCGSRMLEGWVSPYEATAVRRLREAGAGERRVAIARALLAARDLPAAADVALRSARLAAAGISYTEFSYQLSDHFPVWVQIKTDIDGERLTQIVQNAKKG